MKEYCFIIAQILGALMFILNIYGNTKLTTKKIFKFNNIVNGIGVAQYALLGAWAGSLCCFIAMCRNIVFGKFKNKVPLYVLLIYIVIVIVSNYKLIHSPIDIIPVSNIIVYAIGLWSKDIMKIKVFGIYTCVVGFIYDFKKRAYFTMLNETIDGLVGLRCVFILRKRKKVSVK